MKFILNFTPTGMIPTKDMTPYVPIQPDEIIEQVLDVAELGVNMVHLHARDPDTREPTYKKEVYGQIISGIRKQASINAPEMIKMLARKMMDNGIRPELEAFDLGMINYAKYLIQKGFIKPPCYFNLILGNIACAQATMLNLGLMVNELPQGSLWSAGGIGDWQIQMNTMALVAGGGVRVGLEDNIYYDRQRSDLASNRQLVERILLISKALGRVPYTHKETRELLCLHN